MPFSMRKCALSLVLVVVATDLHHSIAVDAVDAVNAPISVDIHDGSPASAVKAGHMRGSAQVPAQSRQLKKKDRMMRKHNRKNADKDMREYMGKMQVKELTTEVMVDETLLLDGEVISFADEHLEPINVMVDRNATDAKKNKAKSHVFLVLESGRQTDSAQDESVVQAVKRKGVVIEVTKRNMATGEVINAVPMKDGVTYAIFSTNDIDIDELNKIKLHALTPPKSRMLQESSEPTTNANVTGGNATLPGDNQAPRNLAWCSRYQTIRMEVRFDSQFCHINGGWNGAVDKIKSIVNSVNNIYRYSPGLCMRVRLYSYSGSCDWNRDPYRQIIDQSSGLCGDSGSSLISKFREYIYPPGTTHQSRYRYGGADTTHLFFGGYWNKHVDHNTAGCAYKRSLCNEYAIGASHIGKYTWNPTIEVMIMAHEIAHNAGAEHDWYNGYVMQPNLCPTCPTFSWHSMNSMRSYVGSVDNWRCIS